jgi:hypothetical protein
VESAFLKSDTAAYDIKPKTMGNIKIKIEVDKTPPLGFETEPKLLLLPFSFYTPCFVPSDLFAGKMHALLFRKWKTRVKGRDWYDFEWYIRNDIPLNLAHFNTRMRESEKAEGVFDEKGMRTALNEKIRTLDIEQTREEVQPFIRNPEVLKIWSKDYFLELAKRLKFVAG